MKVVSFNVNGIRARNHQLKKLVEKHSPDIIGLQEVKVRDEEFPIEDIESLGYNVEFFGQKSHYGVAILSKEKFEFVQKGYPWDSEDAQRRLIEGRVKTESGETVTVINGYFPQGESRDHETKFPYKVKFYADLNKYIRETFTPDDNLLIIGDMNIASTDLDIGIGEDNRKRWLRTGKCSFLPEEREWLEELMSWGLKDSFREKYADEDNLFSWFDYRSKGFDREPKRGLRIDLILATEKMMNKLKDVEIDYEIRAMEKPSDHCPVIGTFDI
ncbi:MAG: exodeoxyribonuclease III [Melioribacteraceae bacterium]|nr:exodeoxyribonuclease III [Melioribacteraceae bacterium]